MKQWITAIIERITIDEDVLPLPDQPDIELEFSAIDTGGGFHDPILDFTYQIPADKEALPQQDEYVVTLLIRDPADESNQLTIAHHGPLKQENGRYLEGMGRLKDEKIDRDMVKFIMRCLR